MVSGQCTFANEIMQLTGCLQQLLLASLNVEAQSADFLIDQFSKCNFRILWKMKAGENREVH